MLGFDSLAATRPWRPLAAAFAAMALAVGCGGGDGDSVGTGGTGAPLSFASGRITGFGSVIVNGVRFDDTTAAVTDDDGAAHTKGDLKLGMTVDVEGGAISTDNSTGASTATASSIQFGSEIKGPVESVNVAGNTLVVLGQTIVADAATVFDGLAGVAAVQAGDLIEVFAFFDASSATYKASRIELEPTLTEFKLRGVIANLDTTAKTFTIGAATIGFGNIAASDLPALSNGMVVRVKLQTTQQAGVWIATQVKSGVHAVPDHARSEVEGIVTDYVSLASFKVNGVAVDASGASVVFENGTGLAINNGVRVEVEGTTANGVLVASKVEIKQADGEDVEIELHGAIDAADAAAQTFSLRGQTVHYDSSTRIDDGTLAGLVVGAQVEVRGTLSATGNEVIATRIKFEH